LMSQRAAPKLICIGALFAVAAIVAVGCGGSDGSPAESVQPSETSIVRGSPASLPPQAGLQVLAPFPFAIDVDVTAWTGSQLLVFGTERRAGGRSVDDAAAMYEPAMGTWRTLPSDPIGPALSGASGVWTGEELVIVGVACDNRATENDELPRCFPGSVATIAYDVQAESWHRLPDPDIELPEGNEGSLGGAIGFDGRRAIFDFGDALWTFDPRRSEWAALDRAPGDPTVLCLAGEVLVSAGFVAGSLSTPDSRPSGASGVRVDVVEPGSRSWRTLPVRDAPASFSPSSSLCLEDELLLTTRNFDPVYLLDLATGALSQQPSPPLSAIQEPFFEGVPRPPDVPANTSFVDSAWTGRVAVWWNPARSFDAPIGEPKTVHAPGNAVLFDPASGVWSVTESGPPTFGLSQTKIAWADGVGYTIASEAAARPASNNVMTYRPQPVP
jgi:hypothetical protein